MRNGQYDNIIYNALILLLIFHTRTNQEAKAIVESLKSFVFLTNIHIILYNIQIYNIYRDAFFSF